MQDALIAAFPKAELANVHAAFEKYLVMEDCELQPEESSAVWQIAGPKAGRGFGGRASQRSPSGGLIHDGLAVVIAEEAQVSAIETALTEAVANAGGVIGDEAAREAFRQERGVPRFGFDFDVTTYPQEAGLEKRAVAFDKGCYLGQEVVCMLELRGHVKRKLVSLEIDSSALPAKGDAVTNAAGEKIGEVTSAASSPAFGALALAMVKAGNTDAGTELTVAGAKAKVRPIAV